MGKFRDITGQKFGRYTVIKRVANKGKQPTWLCVCECGVIKQVQAGNLKNGGTVSCGCHRADRGQSFSLKHGLKNDALYNTYMNMIKRCYNKTNDKYKYYGGRGISICKEWLNKENGITNFINWCKKNDWEENLEIDRVDNNGNYEPSNCRFTTKRENILNRRRFSNNKSGYTGVSLHKQSQKWRTQLSRKGELVFNGVYDNKRDAVDARNNYIIENNLQHEYKIQEYI